MDSGTKTYQIDKHKQLIPLNGSTVNFSCFFEVKSKDKKPFQLTIVEQGKIKPKEYKLVEDGYINGQIESDGQLKSYFLVLKAQQPCECDVRIILKPKDATSATQQQQPINPPPNQPPQDPTNQPPQQDPTNVMVLQTQESYFQTKYILGISAFLIVSYLVYKYRKAIFGKFKNNTVMPSVSNSSF
jgi:hypothetical protein